MPSPRLGGACFRGGWRGRSGPAAAGGVAAAVDDPQPHPGRGGVLGRVPGEPAGRAGRGGEAAAAGVFSVAFLSIDSILETLMTSTSRARAQAASAACGPYRFASPISR